MKIYTIGFTRKTAQDFFGALRAAGVARVLDVRLNNTSQLAGFAKRDDLQFFLRELGGIDYRQLPELAPTAELLSAYRGKRLHWDSYAQAFTALLAQRQIENTLPKPLFDGGCLLCSEAEPHHCHRRLVAEYLAVRWDGVEIMHLR